MRLTRLFLFRRWTLPFMVSSLSPFSKSPLYINGAFHSFIHYPSCLDRKAPVRFLLSHVLLIFCSGLPFFWSQFYSSPLAGPSRKPFSLFNFVQRPHSSLALRLRLQCSDFPPRRVSCESSFSFPRAVDSSLPSAPSARFPTKFFPFSSRLYALIFLSISP